MKKLAFLSLSLFAMVFFISCNNTTIIEDTCMVCHNDANMQAVTQQFNQSVHNAGAIAVDYAGGRASCAQCHSDEGFIEYAATGMVEENPSSPSAFRCKTCHNIHTTFEEDDYAMRLGDPVAFIYDTTVMFDSGNGNLCVNCHQSRRAEPNVTDPGATFEITSSHYGPHHGAQGNTVYGAGFAEIAGSKSYPTAANGAHYTASCTGCHMGDYGAGAGGHTYRPNVESCNACHGSNDEDFNYGGVADEIEAQLETLRDLLVAADVLEMHEEDDGSISYEPVVGEHSMDEARAFFNWVGLDEDRSLGAHNPKYVDALLTNSIEAMQ